MPIPIATRPILLSPIGFPSNAKKAKRMALVLRIVLGYIAAVISAYVIGTALNAQFVMGAHGVPIGIGERFNMTMFDISNMTLYAVIIAIGFAIAFIIAAVIKRFLPGLASVAYPIAGAAAIGVALGLMYMNFQTVPISGARGTFGFLAQMLSGALGGWVFGMLQSTRANA